MNRLTTPKKKTTVQATILVAAVILGGAAGKQLFESNANVRTASIQYGVLQARTHSQPGPAIVPFEGPFNLYGCGPAIKQLHTALIKLHFRKRAPANCYGKPTRNQVMAFQKSIHYKQTGKYNLVTHQAMVKRGGYTRTARLQLIKIAFNKYVYKYRYTVSRVGAHAALVGGDTLSYSQSGSRSYFPAWPRIPPATDCSGFATWIEYQAGAGAQIGYYGPGSPVGWTGTLTVQGRWVKFHEKLEPGDMVFYPSRSSGGRPWGHMAIYIGHGMVVSHGHTGVDVVPYNYRPVGEIRRLIDLR